MTFARMQFKIAVRDTVLFVLALALVLAGFSAFAQPVSIGGGGTGSGPMKRGYFLKPTQYATQSALTLYVDGSGSGNDGYTCTSTTTPCATIQGAVNKIPMVVQHPVTVGIDGGSYAGFALVNHTFNAANTTNGAYISISGGAQVNTTPATGTATGTVTSVTTDSVGFHLVSDSGQTWTSSDTNITTRFLTLTGGTGAGQVCPIFANTATQVSVSCTFSPAPVAGTTYAITTPSTTLTSTVNNTATATVSAGGAAAMVISEIGFQRFNSGFVLVSDIGVTNVSTAAVTDVRGLTFRRVRASNSNATINGIGNFLGNTRALILASVSSMTSASSNGILLGSSGTTAGGPDVTIQNSYISANTPVNIVGINELAITTSQISNTTASSGAVNWGVGGGMLTVTGSRLSCASASGNAGLLVQGINSSTNAGAQSPKFATVKTASEVTGCATGVSAAGSTATIAISTTACTLLSNTLGVSATYGGKVVFANNTVPTFTTNGTDISVDGDTYTRAAFVALTPNAVTNMNYLSSIYLQP